VLNEASKMTPQQDRIHRALVAAMVALLDYTNEPVDQPESESVNLKALEICLKTALKETAKLRRE